MCQQFKYNGWLLGAIVILAASLGILVNRDQRNRAKLLATWGFGLVAAIVAAAVYWPWFSFVNLHGGYGALLRHHSSYLGGVASWFDHWRLQLEEAALLSGGPVWNAAAWAAACLSCGLISLSTADPARRLRATLVAGLLLPLMSFAPSWFWWVGVPWVLFRWRQPSPSERILVVAWLGLSVLTPLYYPYARLWLPLQALGWVLVAGLVAVLLGPASEMTSQFPKPAKKRRIWTIQVAVLCAALALIQGVALRGSALGRGRPPGVLDPSDSVKVAVRQALADLPAETPAIRVLARPMVRFYLAGRVPAEVAPNVSGLLEPGDPRRWALVDHVQLRQEGDVNAASSRMLSRWDIVGEYPTVLNLPTLLDVDPGAARAGGSETTTAPLWLLRPKAVRTRR
jgi:hypothetical protein